MPDLDPLVRGKLQKERSEYLDDLESRFSAIRGDVVGAVARGRRIGRIRAVSLVAAAVVVALGVSSIDWKGSEPVAGEALLPNPLPEPPRSLRSVLPDEVDGVVQPGLVLLYRDGDSYVAYSEGVSLHSCPMGGKRCFSTAIKAIFESDIESYTGSQRMRVADPPEGAEVLWRGVPASGFIGAEAPDACSRIERFVPYFACDDDSIRETEPEEVTLAALGGTASIPKDWRYNPAVQFPHLTVDLITSNNPTLLNGAVAGGGASRVRSIDAATAAPADVFLEVIVSYPPPISSSSELAPLPSAFDPAEAPLVGRAQGEPIYAFTGSTEDSGIATIRFWAGPEASRSARAQLEYAVSGIHPEAAPPEAQQEKTSFGFGRLPEGDMEECPPSFSLDGAGATQKRVRNTASKVLGAANGEPARPAVLWKLLDRNVREEFGSFEHFHDLFVQEDLSAGPGERDVYTRWDLYPVVLRGGPREGDLMLGDVRHRCGRQVSEATWVVQAGFPDFNGVSGGAVQMYFIARPSGPRLWFID